MADIFNDWLLRQDHRDIQSLERWAYEQLRTQNSVVNIS